MLSSLKTKLSPKEKAGNGQSDLKKKNVCNVWWFELRSGPTGSPPGAHGKPDPQAFLPVTMWVASDFRG